jgi:hypothetical protein
MKIGGKLILKFGLTAERSEMKGNPGTARDRDIVLENFAAELTEAAYPVALRYGVVGSSIDLELDLWRVFVETIKEWRRDAGLPL